MPAGKAMGRQVRVGERTRMLVVVSALACALGALLAAMFAGSARADFPYNPNNATPPFYHLPAGLAPMNTGGNAFKYAATPENSPTSEQDNSQPDELCGVMGGSIVDANATQPSGTNSCIAAGTPVRTAFETTTGRPDVVIAVLDSGIEWNNSGYMFDVRRKVHLNEGELPVPWVDPTMSPSLDPSVGPTVANQPPPTAASCAALATSAASAMGGTPVNGVYENANGIYDLFGNGAFNVSDYACDPRVKAALADPRSVSPAGLLTPQALILAFGNCKLDESSHQIDPQPGPASLTAGCPDGQHYDNDANGYANDIVG